MQFDPTLWAQEITRKIRDELDKLKTFNFGDVTEVIQKSNGGYQARVLVDGASSASIPFDCMTDYIPTVGDHVMIMYPKGSSPVIMGATPAAENTITAGSAASSIGGLKGKTLGGSAAADVVWYKIARIQQANPISGSEGATLSGTLYAQADYGTASRLQQIIDFSFAVRGESPFRPVWFTRGNAPESSDINDRIEAEIRKAADGWHYLYMKLPQYTKPISFLYTSWDCIEYWQQESPAGTLIWSSETGETQDIFVGKKKVYHAGNFNPADYLPKTGGTISSNLTVSGNHTVNGTSFINGDLYLAANRGIYSAKLSGAYILRDHNNGNVTVSAAGGALYLGYINTTLIEIGGTPINNVDQLNGQYGNMMRSYDEWLRINHNNEHTNGIYCNNSVLRTDGELQVGATGGTFRASSSYLSYKGDNILRGYSGTAKAVYLNATQLSVAISYSLTSGSTARVICTPRWVSGSVSMIKVATVFVENVTTTGATIKVYADNSYSWYTGEYMYIDWIVVPDV